ncbi:MAG TPA: phage tail tube protein [Gemmatimonadales bacterium]|nr:phage tail tube protein [Gemmatimonadales bacterium]
MSGLDAFGTTLERETITPGTFAALAKITNIGGPGISRETLDVTAHDSPDGWREFLGGLKDGGEVSADINYDPADHDTLVADLDAQAINYRITWPGGAKWAFPAILTGFEPSAPFDDKLTASITWKVAGKPTLTAAP